jgi:hypothetical protein
MFVECHQWQCTIAQDSGYQIQTLTIRWLLWLINSRFDFGADMVSSNERIWNPRMTFDVLRPETRRLNSDLNSPKVESHSFGEKTMVELLPRASRQWFVHFLRHKTENGYR